MPMIDVSIIIVNWNTRDVLRNCLASIYEQAQDIEYEIIVMFVQLLDHAFNSEMYVNRCSAINYAIRK